VSPRRTETLLVLACAAAAALLAASQFTNLFELTPPGGEALGEIKADDQHGYATLIVAALAMVLLVVALAARDRSLAQGACFGVAVCGVIALLIFLVIDLPDAGNIGALDDDSFIDAKAEPVAGFWFELVGSLVLTACGAALATMRRERAGARGRDEQSGQDENRQGRAADPDQTSGQSFEPSGSARG
jgi:hypothetical protein